MIFSSNFSYCFGDVNLSNSMKNFLFHSQKDMALADYVRLITENKRILDELHAKSQILDRDTEEATQKLHAIRTENIKLSSEQKVLDNLVVEDTELDQLMK